MATTDVHAANKRLVQREVREVWAEVNDESIAALFAPDVVIGTRRMGDEETLASRDDIREHHREWMDGFPDATFEIHELLAEGDAVMFYWTMEATHTGQFRGYAPTGNAVSIDGFGFRRIQDGKITVSTDSASMVTLLDQIGVTIPSS
ncbi:ester cyclase [Haladaptatus sp. DYSN1]|uniref:ester cyclase n=1 Tax=unclassified Haladaptatus TaxID=2622732 RepID=UPI002405D66C|nr:ester cyclase [Haladaptatus sp. DYSN1]